MIFFSKILVPIPIEILHVDHDVTVSSCALCSAETEYMMNFRYLFFVKITHFFLVDILWVCTQKRVEQENVRIPVKNTLPGTWYNFISFPMYLFALTIKFWNVLQFQDLRQLNDVHDNRLNERRTRGTRSFPKIRMFHVCRMFTCEWCKYMVSTMNFKDFVS